MRGRHEIKLSLLLNIFFMETKYGTCPGTLTGPMAFPEEEMAGKFTEGWW